MRKSPKSEHGENVSADQARQSSVEEDALIRRPSRRKRPASKSPAAESAPQRGFWTFLSSWQARLGIVGGVLAGLIAILTQSQTIWNFFRAFFPAELNVAITACKSDELTVEITHLAGAATWLGPPSFVLHSPTRGETPLRADLYSLDENPSQRRLISPRANSQPGVASYHYGGARARFYNRQEVTQGHCEIDMTLPVDDRRDPITRNCPCVG